MTPDLKRLVRRRARGRCEYCRMLLAADELSAELDHIIAAQHRGRTVAENLAWTCAHCNVHKGPNIAGIDPETGALSRLFNPRTDVWKNHFQWFGAHLTALTPEGRCTLYVLAINDPVRVLIRESLIEEGRL